jgi:hypothetical protein
MYKTISNKIIRQFNPCYDPSKVIIDENEELSVKQWVEKYRDVVPAKDIIWLLLRKEFLSEKDLRLFAVWCAREALKLVTNPDDRIVEACNAAERYANGEATKEELLAARNAAAHTTDAVYTFVYHVYNAAYYTVYDDIANTDYAAANTDYAAANAARAASHASDAASDVSSDVVYAANAARAAQIDQLLTYFE